MKLLNLLGMSAFAVTCLATGVRANPIGIQSTNPLSLNGVLDVSNWHLVSPPPGAGALYDVTGTVDYPGAWSAGTNWISPGAGEDQPPGDTGTSDQFFVYQTTFNLAGLDPTTAIITGNFASDNQGTVLINGIQIADNSAAASTYGSPTGFSIPDIDLHSGNNVLEFDVDNIVCSGCSSGNPTGLLVNITEDTAATSSPAPIPEPVTISLFGMGLFGAVLARRRKTKKA